MILKVADALKSYSRTDPRRRSKSGSPSIQVKEFNKVEDAFSQINSQIDLLRKSYEK